MVQRTRSHRLKSLSTSELETTAKKAERKRSSFSGPCLKDTDSEETISHVDLNEAPVLPCRSTTPSRLVAKEFLGAKSASSGSLAYKRLGNSNPVNYVGAGRSHLGSRMDKWGCKKKLVLAIFSAAFLIAVLLILYLLLFCS